MEIVDHSRTRQRPGEKRRGSPCPGLEKALGAVEMLLVPSDCKDFDSPASVPEACPKAAGELGYGSSPGSVEAAPASTGLSLQAGPAVPASRNSEATADSRHHSVS